MGRISREFPLTSRLQPAVHKVSRVSKAVFASSPRSESTCVYLLKQIAYLGHTDRLEKRLVHQSTDRYPTKRAQEREVPRDGREEQLQRFRH